MLPLQPLRMPFVACRLRRCVHRNCCMFILSIANNTPARACFNIMRSLHSSSKHKPLILHSECSATSSTQCRIPSFSIPAKACFKRRKLSNPAFAYQSWTAGSGLQVSQSAATSQSSSRIGARSSNRNKGICRYVQCGCTNPADPGPAILSCCQSKVAKFSGPA